ncbi:PREDICTED: uncharacterized protein LOC107164689 isoform X2 [Diuraphis noxia]|uniref:uncharacterized protein LOC107164689 isoform X2 n=1 Tax=Diuraphis noxia TaxID=143948 RepID=UPI0007637EE6|nr:PREDICTED: uncharacterized protein LOC107164689 isoform X2 [Diuraphis noxia]
MTSSQTSTTSVRQCSVLSAILLLLVAVVASFPSSARSSAIRPALSTASTDAAASPLVPSSWQGASANYPDEPASAAGRTVVVRKKRTLLKLKPLIVLPVKVALGTGAKLVAGAKLGAKAVGLGSKALGVGLVGLKAAHKVTKVTVKAATALGVKAVLLNFLFQKINQVIDFKTRLLSNLDQRNRQQNAQFLSPVLPQSSSSSKSGSIGNKDNATGAAAFVPAPDFVAAPDTTGFVTNAPSPAAPAFVPGSDLIASPPPPSSQPDFDGPPSDFVGTPTNFDSTSSSFGGASSGFPAFQPSFASEPSGFAATNDDGSPSSETSF